MPSKFFKYSGTGNDFIVLDNREALFDQIWSSQWREICQRKVGIGADGILLFCKSREYDFRMRYFNADGGEVPMCGNGARVLTSFAQTMIPKNEVIKKFIFETQNGVYFSEINEEGLVRLQMTEFNDQGKIEISDLFESDHSCYLNTGVPHCIFSTKNIDDLDLMGLAPKIRFNSRFDNGANINFFERVNEHTIKLRTYERGVEEETMACGTGAVAAAIFCAQTFGIDEHILVKMKGGDLTIEYSKDFKEVYLCGKVEKVFTGELSL